MGWCALISCWPVDQCNVRRGAEPAGARLAFFFVFFFSSLSLARSLAPRGPCPPRTSTFWFAQLLTSSLLLLLLGLGTVTGPSPATQGARPSARNSEHLHGESTATVVQTVGRVLRSVKVARSGRYRGARSSSRRRPRRGGRHRLAAKARSSPRTFLPPRCTSSTGLPVAHACKTRRVIGVTRVSSPRAPFEYITASRNASSSPLSRVSHRLRSE